MRSLSGIEGLIRPLRSMVARRTDVYRVEASSLCTGVKEIGFSSFLVTRLDARSGILRDHDDRAASVPLT